MNVLVIFLLGACLIAFVCVAFFRGRNTNELGSLFLLCLGVMVIAGGVYLYPATMWRSISYGMLGVGAIMVIGSVTSFFHRKRGHNERKGS